MTTPPTTLKTARNLVQQAESAYQGGDDITCARLLWEATMSAFQELAARMGYPCANREEAKQFAIAMDDANQLRTHYLINLDFGIAMLEHSEGADWTEDPEFAWQFNEFPMAISATHDTLDWLQARILEA